MILRDLYESLRVRDRTNTQLLTAVARAPYNVDLTDEATEYLLLNGRAVVFLDGLDELTDVALRRRVADLVHGFVSAYPLVPVVATSRTVGYADAPLERGLFRACLIAPFDTKQVCRYAENWFAADDSAPANERDRLREAFLRESTAISDLRSSPLLLSLLCSMYSSEQFIPRNRAQVYERCAIMVFDRWDSMRGITLPVEFEGKVRGAVQALAWHMFVRDDAAEMPRGKVLRIIVDYLVAKRFDEDDARALANEFLAFCAGRAWVLAEVGSTDTEPIYAFAHRTFLEYFTAEHIARHHPTPEQTWSVLQPHLGDSRWSVVTHLVVQLIERGVEDGAEALVRLALARDGSSDPSRVAFAADACGLVGLSPDVIAAAAHAAIDCLCAWPLRDRISVWFVPEVDEPD